MAVEIRVNPSYIGLQGNADCVYKWSWYVWDPNSNTVYQPTDKVRETIGTSPDTTPLAISVAVPTNTTNYSVQLVVKENTIAETVVCSSTVQTVVVEPTECTGVCS
jgi:hypothetical protein